MNDFFLTIYIYIFWLFNTKWMKSKSMFVEILMNRVIYIYKYTYMKESNGSESNKNEKILKT